MADVVRCEYCQTGRADGRPGCHQPGCPGNPDAEKDGEDPRLIKAIRDEVIRTNLRWHGRPTEPVPQFGADKVYVSEIWLYVRAALKVVREFEGKPRDFGDLDVEAD